MKWPSLRFFIKLTVCSALLLTLFVWLNPALGLHSMIGYRDEAYYVDRSMQNIQFLEGVLPASDVSFTYNVNHPFSGELLMGISLFAQGQNFAAKSHPFATNLTEAQLVAARQSDLFVGLLGVAAILFVSMDLSPLAAIPIILFILSSPGFLNYSTAAMLDIFTATFTTITLVSMYYYVVKEEKRGLWIGAIFLGLSFGSKTAWDPIVASVAVIAAIVYSRPDAGFKTKMRSLAMASLLVIATFCLTSTVVLFRISSQIRDVLGASVLRDAPGISGTFHTVALSNIITTQPLVSYTMYSIFASQLPSYLAVFGALLAISIGLGLFRSKLGSMTSENHRLLTFLFIVGLFVCLDALLTGSSFEFGRSYVRIILYEGFFVALSLGFLSKINRRISIVMSAAAGLISVYFFANYTDAFWSYLPATGNVFVPGVGAPVATLEGWALLILFTLGILIFGTLSSWPLVAGAWRRLSLHK